MKIRLNLLLAILTVAMLLLSSCDKTVDSLTTRTTIALRASGEVEVAPDEATLTIHLSGLRPNAKTAKAYLIQQSNALRDTLTSFGVSPDHIQTLNVSLERSYTWRNNSQVFTGYRASTSMVITISQLDRLDEIYDELLDRRELDTYGPIYSHSRMDSLRNLAYLRALEQADVLGDALQGRLSVKHRAVRAIGNVELEKPNSYDYAADAEARQASVVQSAAPRFEVSTGLIQVREDLYVNYEVW